MVVRGHGAPFTIPSFLRRAAIMSAKPSMTITFALLTCTLSGCSEMNTRIGLPWTYWSHGFWPVIGCLGILLLLLMGMAAVICSSDGRTKGDQVGMFLLGFGVFLVAGLILQAFPPSTSGIQYVPLPPWNYAGWIPWIISVACWLCITLGCLTAFSSHKRDWEGAAISIFTAFCLNALLSFYTPSDATIPETVAVSSSVVTSYKDKLTQLDTLKEHKTEALGRLVSDRESLVARIRGLGVQSKRELMAHSVGRTLAEELEQVSRQISTLRNDKEALEATLERANSMLRCVERQIMLKNHGLSSKEEYARLSKIDHELQEALRTMTGARTPDSEVNVDKMLDGVLAPAGQAQR